MNRFRIRNNVPDVYVKKSRDFQLLCDLFDIVNNGVKFDIDSIMDLSNTQLTRDSMLPYLQDKLGFKTSKELPQDVLRILLKAFPYLVKKKGSRKGIEEAICLFLNLIYADCKYTIEIFNNKQRSVNGNYFVMISLNDNLLKNLNILDDLLKYVLPAGYVLNYQLAYSIEDIVTNIYPQDEITITLINEQFGSKPRRTYWYKTGNDESAGNKIYEDIPEDTLEEYTPQKRNSPIGAVGTTVITTGGDPYSKNPEMVSLKTETFNEFKIPEDKD